MVRYSWVYLGLFFFFSLPLFSASRNVQNNSLSINKTIKSYTRGNQQEKNTLLEQLSSRSNVANEVFQSLLEFYGESSVAELERKQLEPEDGLFRRTLLDKLFVQLNSEKLMSLASGILLNDPSEEVRVYVAQSLQGVDTQDELKIHQMLAQSIFFDDSRMVSLQACKSLAYRSKRKPVYAPITISTIKRLLVDVEHESIHLELAGLLFHLSDSAVAHEVMIEILKNEHETYTVSAQLGVLNVVRAIPAKKISHQLGGLCNDAFSRFQAVESKLLAAEVLMHHQLESEIIIQWLSHTITSRTTSWQNRDRAVMALIKSSSKSAEKTEVLKQCAFQRELKISPQVRKLVEDYFKEPSCALNLYDIASIGRHFKDK